MTEFAECRCIVCSAKLKNVDEGSVNQPSGGTAFTTNGHYGSTAFDPMDGSYLEITVCDKCLRARAATGQHVYFGRERKPVVSIDPDSTLAMPELVGWTRAHRTPTPWNPDAEHDREELFIEYEHVGNDELFPEVDWMPAALRSKAWRDERRDKNG